MSGIIKWVKILKRAVLLGEKTSFFLPILILIYNFPSYGEKCIECHEEKKLEKADAHYELSCSDCHSFKKGIEHPENVVKVNCGNCHEKVIEEEKKSIHSQEVKGKRNADCSDCHSSHPVLPLSDVNSPVFKKNIPKTCARCHEDEALVREKEIPIKKPLKAYIRSVHGKAVVERGEVYAAVCSDCHGTHDIRRGNEPSSTINRLNVPKTCGKCHYGVFTAFMGSIHGEGFKKGAQDAPVCTTCHGEHEILPPEIPESLVWRGKISKETCTQCHASERIVKKYGIPADRFITYEDSYHGLADKYGDTTVANCASCHGYHDIYPSSDPRSTVNPSNLPKTCGKCHPGATAKFAIGKVHGEIKRKGELGDIVKYYVRLIYLILIPLIIISMFFHNFLDFYKRLKIAIEKRKKEKTYIRLNAQEKIQHLLMFISFIILVITGFALRFKWNIPVLSGEINSKIRSLTHRSAAVLFMVACAWHLLYVLSTAEGRKFFLDMIPRWRDLKDLVNTLLYYLNINEKPKYTRFSYVEKSEYFALIWGAVVMIVTGLILWFEEFAMRFIPKWGVDVADIIHYYEAILATLAILVWHFYHVHIKGGVEKMNLSWLTGVLTHEEMEEEHAELLEGESDEKM